MATKKHVPVKSGKSVKPAAKKRLNLLKKQSRLNLRVHQAGKLFRLKKLLLKNLLQRRLLKKRRKSPKKS